MKRTHGAPPSDNDNDRSIVKERRAKTQTIVEEAEEGREGEDDVEDEDLEDDQEDDRQKQPREEIEIETLLVALETNPDSEEIRGAARALIKKMCAFVEQCSSVEQRVLKRLGNQFVSDFHKL